MITTRLAQEQDSKQIELLCAKYGWEVPQGVIIVGADEKNKIHGLIAVSNTAIISPIVCEENPILANTLHNTAIGLIMGSNLNEVRVWTGQPDLVNMYKRLGYHVVAENVTILKRSV